MYKTAKPLCAVYYTELETENRKEMIGEKIIFEAISKNGYIFRIFRSSSYIKVIGSIS